MAAPGSAQAAATSTNSKPSFRAASARRSSSVTISSDEGRRSAARKAAASCSPQRMNAKKPQRVLADDLAGFDLVPPVSELFQPIEGQGSGFPVEQSAALEAGQGRSALHLRSPPHQHVRIALASPCRDRVVVSATSSGTIAEASQNFTAPRGARR
jgi:hypothetical protein